MFRGLLKWWLGEELPEEASCVTCEHLDETPNNHLCRGCGLRLENWKPRSAIIDSLKSKLAEREATIARYETNAKIEGEDAKLRLKKFVKQADLVNEQAGRLRLVERGLEEEHRKLMAAREQIIVLGKVVKHQNITIDRQYKRIRELDMAETPSDPLGVIAALNRRREAIIREVHIRFGLMREGISCETCFHRTVFFGGGVPDGHPCKGCETYNNWTVRDAAPDMASDEPTESDVCECDACLPVPKDLIEAVRSGSVCDLQSEMAKYLAGYPGAIKSWVTAQAIVAEREERPASPNDRIAKAIETILFESSGHGFNLRYNEKEKLFALSPAGEFGEFSDDNVLGVLECGANRVGKLPNDTTGENQPLPPSVGVGGEEGLA